MDRRTRWVLLAYRLPREPSTPRISVWRQLRRLGAAQERSLAAHMAAKVVHGADVTENADITPQSRGLEAVARGFMHLGLTHQEQLRLELPVIDALCAWAQGEVSGS